ncbi:MAG: glycine cleavage system aminomethyltransferase GcvT [Christensenellales bacterium]|jgi:aminomethyltransferase
MDKKTPLYDTHISLKGKIVPFAGYLLPVQYEGVIAEHMAVRTKAGIFDVSHMGEVTFRGADAEKAINYLVTNDIRGMEIGQARYSPMCNENGGVVDDLIIHKFASDYFVIVVNAANKDKDVAWIRDNLPEGDVIFRDISDDVAQIALQGPSSPAILKKLMAPGEIPKKNYRFTAGAAVAGKSCLMVARTGYTGETGFEIYCSPEDVRHIWDELMQAGEEHGLAPCGLGARDTLRLEAGMPLYGHEMTDDILPFHTGLGFTVKLEKDNFIGKKALESAERDRTRVGLKVTGRGIVREHCDLYDGEKLVGKTTSGTHSPLLGYPIAMAIVQNDCASDGKVLFADVRGRRVEVQVIPLPFYKKKASTAAKAKG